MAQKKYVTLTRLSNFLDNIKAKYSQIGHKHTVSDLTDYTPISVDTELSSTSNNPVANSTLNAEFDAVSTAMNALELVVDNKADADHNHNDNYYTEEEIDQKLETKSDKTHKHDADYDAKGAASEAISESKAYTDNKLSVYDPNNKRVDIFAYADARADVAVSILQEQFTVSEAPDQISNVIEWKKATSPNGFNARQRGCCYGNGYYVVAGTSGQMVYSHDCLAWTLVPSFTSAVITALTYGSGKFIAVDSDGNVFSAATPDGTWETGLDAGGVINSVRYINNRFVAVGENGFAATSKDGNYWGIIEVLEQSQAYFTDCTWGNGYYIVVGKQGAVWRSVNLSDWEDCTIADFGGDIRTARFVAGGFVVGGQGGKIYYSADGKTWTMATNNSALAIAYVRDFTYAEKRIYAYSYASDGKGEIWLSTDNGATWSVVLTTSGRLWCAAYGNGRFVTSGDNGAIYVLDLGIEWDDEEPVDGVSIWRRYIATLSNGDKIISESYKVAEKSHTHNTSDITDLQFALDELKAYTDEVASGKSDTTHNHDSAYDAKGSADNALASAKSYADSAASTVKNDLLNGAGGAYDTLKELGDLIDENTDAIDALETVAAGKADKTHTHTISDVTDLQEATISTAGLLSAEDKIKLNYGGSPIITTSGDGANYTVTISGMDALTAGMSFIMIPHTVSTTTAPKLNVNGLGAKLIRRRVSNSTVTTVAGSAAGWLGANKPVRVTYDGAYWIVDFVRPNATDIYGTMPVTSGGTGFTSIVDSVYTTARYRASALFNTEANPTDNGVINWTYE